MRRVLLVKTSSLGDVLHTLPAVTEASARTGVRFDWVVEPAFAPVADWHPAVDRVLEASVRAWRRAPRRLGSELPALRRTLRAESYDCVIDAQGLIKSAALARLARGPRAGFDAASVRERPAAWAYERIFAVDRDLHAVERTRALFGHALGYSPGDAAASTPPDAGLSERRARAPAADPQAVLLMPGTTWRTKHWPEAHWLTLARLLADAGRRVRVIAGTDSEAQRAERIASAGGGRVEPRGDLDVLFDAVASAGAVVGVDAGPLHLASALGVPGVALYGPTDPGLTGPWRSAIRIEAATLPCAPCRARVCRSPLAPEVDISSGASLEPPCLGALSPEQVLRGVLAMDR